jgi:hypothetical protein
MRSLVQVRYLSVHKHRKQLSWVVGCTRTENFYSKGCKHEWYFGLSLADGTCDHFECLSAFSSSVKWFVWRFNSVSPKASLGPWCRVEGDVGLHMKAFPSDFSLCKNENSMFPYVCIYLHTYMCTYMFFCKIYFSLGGGKHLPATGLPDFVI